MRIIFYIKTLINDIVFIMHVRQEVDLNEIFKSIFLSLIIIFSILKYNFFATFTHRKTPNSIFYPSPDELLIELKPITNVGLNPLPTFSPITIYVKFTFNF